MCALLVEQRCLALLERLIHSCVATLATTVRADSGGTGRAAPPQPDTPTPAPPGPSSLPSQLPLRTALLVLPCTLSQLSSLVGAAVADGGAVGGGGPPAALLEEAVGRVLPQALQLMQHADLALRQAAIRALLTPCMGAARCLG